MRYRYRFDVNGPGSAIGCGAFLLILGIILLTPVVDWLITGLGWVSIVLGLIAVVMGALGWIFNSRRNRL